MTVSTDKTKDFAFEGKDIKAVKIVVNKKTFQLSRL
jgi:hypothetical protein